MLYMNVYCTFTISVGNRSIYGRGLKESYCMPHDMLLSIRRSLHVLMIIIV